MRNKIYRDPRGSLISMDMLGITVRSWSFGGGRSVKKQIYIYINIYGETGVEKKIVPPSPGYLLHLVLVLFCFTLNL